MPGPTTTFFARWEGQYPGAFLTRQGDELVVNVTMLIDHAPTLSRGEQIYAGAWWELVRESEAPWLTAPAFSQLGALDADYRQSIVDLVTAVAASRFA